MAKPKGGAKSARKGSARKSAKDKAAADKAAADAAGLAPAGQSLLDKQDEARELANLDEAVGGNILGSDPLGPSTEHEDHEGGMTDSLAKKGVRGPIPHDEGGPGGESGDEEIDPQVQQVRAPSVRERQLRRGTGRGGYTRPLDAVAALQAANKGEEAQIVRVVATGPGFYGNKRRHRGDVFNYNLTEAEEGLLPSWVEAADGSVPSRQRGETVGVQPSTIVEVHPTGGVSIREGARTTTTTTGISGRGGVGTRAAGTRTAAGAPAAAAGKTAGARTTGTRAGARSAAAKTTAVSGRKSAARGAGK